MAEQGFLDFDGDTYDPALDSGRLTNQLGRVFDLLADEQWHPLPEILEKLGGTTSGLTARARDFRKRKFGGYEVDSRRAAGFPAKSGVWEYRLHLGGRRLVPAAKPLNPAAGPA